MRKFSFRRAAPVLALAVSIPAVSGIAATATKADAQPFPKSCQEVQTHFPHAHNGDYVLFNNGNLFTVYCDMSGTPSEYINL